MLLTKKLVEQWYRLEKFQIYNRKLYGRYNDLYYNITTFPVQFLYDIDREFYHLRRSFKIILTLSISYREFISRSFVVKVHHQYS